MPSKIKKLRTREQFDRWLMRIMKKRRWNKYSRNGIMKDRWAYFAKVINIIVYEIVSNRELIPYTDWQRLNKFLHIPLDHSILKKLSKHNSNFHAPRSLKGMSCEDYLKIQERIREIAKKMKYPPIWLEDEWTS
ncbi:MAG: hypothetical protein IH946_07620 [Bacteroidetes bacterium]|nr:hypothetical protein [Bacteroidota bacterium]